MFKFCFIRTIVFNIIIDMNMYTYSYILKNKQLL